MARAAAAMEPVYRMCSISTTRPQLKKVSPLLFNPEATFDLSLLRLGAFGQGGPAAEIKSLAFHGGIFKKE
jgi:hypothetical protein